ncbi:hypothetical protein [Flexithrix dorotheae]|uniref:hypothetical protein n=1 Tax=Flexithrix dorotheae TaxID=70993 RepID=UPI0012FCC302|nr:hypothetical protein [Flexithrix dorotheae]
MEKIKYLPQLIGCFCIFCLPMFGQNYIYLEETFKEASELLAVQRKGIGTIGKYEFGPYKIISGKAGWTTEKSKNWFISGDAQIQSETKSSFIFTTTNRDTAIVNIAVSSVSDVKESYGFFWRALTNWSYLEQTEREVLLATYSFNSDTSKWNLVLAYPIANEVVYNKEITEDMISKFRGLISNSQMSIDILPVFRWDSGKPATVLKPVEGYTFVFHGETMAAVQVYPVNKMHVWLKKDLPEGLKFTLAAGAATMMVRSF